MAPRIDPFIDVLLREKGDQLYLLPDEPVTMVKDGKPRKVSRQPLTDQHIYALLVEVAPSESADHIDKMAETEFEYVADRGMVRVRIVPDMGRLTAVVARIENSAGARPGAPAPAAQRAPAVAGAPPPPPAPPPRPSTTSAEALGHCRRTHGRDTHDSLGGHSARRPARRLRRAPVQGSRAGPGRAAQEARTVRLLGSAYARGRAAHFPDARGDEAAGHTAAQHGAARADAPGGHAGAQPRRVERDGRLGLRLRNPRARAVPGERGARP